MSDLSHFNARGEARMVDVGGKPATRRVAEAEGRIRMRPETLAQIRAGAHGKGDVLGVARTAGIMAAKRTAELVPLCHPLALSHAAVEFALEEAPAAVRDTLARFEADGFAHVPVCMAKTQYSFSSDPTLRGAPEGHAIPVREVRLSAGAEFVVAICGDIMTMPGLPRVPAAEAIGLGEAGEVVGLF